MDRLVYLFELDSIGTHEKAPVSVSFSDGVQALFGEIIKRGNAVAITMNQLTDSKFIYEILSDPFAYSCFLQLFECGAIKASLYNDIRTASQYMQQAIKKCMNKEDDFKFSNFPLKKGDPLLPVVLNALEYSDLSVLQEMVATAQEEINTAPDAREQKEAACNRIMVIYRAVNMILQISVCETSNIPPKTTPKRTLEQFLSLVINLVQNGDFSQIPLSAELDKAIDILHQRSASIETGRNNRSNWLHLGATETADLLANELINLCYNYTIEDSINGVSKHYDDNDFERTFVRDFSNRLSIACDKILHPKKAYNKCVSKARFKALLRFAKYAAKRSRHKTNQLSETALVYEDGLKKEAYLWVFMVLFENTKALMMSLVYIGLFLIVEGGISFIEKAFSFPIENIFISTLATWLLFGFLGSLVGKGLNLINRKEDIPDVLECIIDILLHFCDFLHMVGVKYDSYKLP